MGQKSLNGSVLWEDEVQLPSSVPANIWGPGCSTTAPGYMLILFNSLMQKTGACFDWAVVFQSGGHER